MKRFYKLVSTETKDHGYVILLDGREIKTPAKNPLVAPTQGLADVIMGEWSAQGEKILPDTMPVTQIISTCIDRVGEHRADMSETVLAYLDTDLLCYWPSEPAKLVGRINHTWQPWLDWFEKRFGVKLATTTNIAALSHPRAAHEAVRGVVENLSDEEFTVLQLVTSLSGSIVLALALIDKAISAEDLFVAARVVEIFKDEVYDAETYGPDPMQEKKDIAMRRDLLAAQEFLSLL